MKEIQVIDGIKHNAVSALTSWLRVEHDISVSRLVYGETREDLCLNIFWNKHPHSRGVTTRSQVIEDWIKDSDLYQEYDKVKDVYRCPDHPDSRPNVTVYPDRSSSYVRIMYSGCQVGSCSKRSLDRYGVYTTIGLVNLVVTHLLKNSCKHMDTDLDLVDLGLLRYIGPASPFIYYASNREDIEYLVSADKEAFDAIRCLRTRAEPYKIMRVSNDYIYEWGYGDGSVLESNRIVEDLHGDAVSGMRDMQAAVERRLSNKDAPYIARKDGNKYNVRQTTIPYRIFSFFESDLRLEFKGVDDVDVLP